MFCFLVEIYAFTFICWYFYHQYIKLQVFDIKGGGQLEAFLKKDFFTIWKIVFVFSPGQTFWIPHFIFFNLFKLCDLLTFLLLTSVIP